MANLTLYEIGAEMEALEMFLEECGGDVSNPDLEKMIDDWIAANEDALSDKLDNYGHLIKNRQMFGEWRRQEAKRLNELASTDEDLVDKLKRRLCEFFLEKKIKKMESLEFKWWVQKNGQRAMTINEDFSGEEGVKLLPERYQKKMIVPDNKAIRDDLSELYGLLDKREACLEQRQPELFTDEDQARLTELEELLDGVAWLEPAGHHVRIK